MCLMSTLETLYELQDVTHYIVANEDYCPWDGLISTNFLTLFEHEKSETKLIQKIARLSLAQNAKIEDSADLTVIQTDGIRDLAHLVKSFRLEPQDFQDAFLIDPNEKDFEFDLYELVINHPNLSESQKAEFHMKFLKTVVFYGTNKSKQATGRPTHGISILKTRNYTGFNSIQRAALDQLEFHQDDI